MSEETKVATETASEETTKEATNDSTDNSALIAESKKYRHRSQEAEASGVQKDTRIAELEAQIKEIEVAKLKETEDFKTLYESEVSKNETLAVDANWAKEYKTKKKAGLLEQHPEEDREIMAKLPLEALEIVTNKINSSKANAPEVVGNPRGTTPSKPFSEMNDTEKRAWHKNVLNNINN